MARKIARSLFYQESRQKHCLQKQKVRRLPITTQVNNNTDMPRKPIYHPRGESLSYPEWEGWWTQTYKRVVIHFQSVIKIIEQTRRSKSSLTSAKLEQNYTVTQLILLSIGLYIEVNYVFHSNGHFIYKISFFSVVFLFVIQANKNKLRILSSQNRQ